MWIILQIFFLLRCTGFRHDAMAQPLEDALKVLEAPSIVVNLTLQSEDGGYVDSRQVRETLSARSGGPSLTFLKTFKIS